MESKKTPTHLKRSWLHLKLEHSILLFPYLVTSFELSIVFPVMLIDQK